MADETKDIKKTEQLSVLLRYYYNRTIHFKFLKFFEADRLDDEGLAEKITQCL